uniref:Serine/threonine-protein phosphatase 7 long form homolog n=1 Tax=Nicotiana tabacum TaxID=4097 RepID=A0A1S3YQZ5_TOBAC|nr:PREDICTED: serine/threonine-protein phosphatase 7 long form homolog [Nicotiana tabacum]
MDVLPVHPGPISDEILVLLGDRRERGFHSRVVQHLRDTGYYRIFEIGRMWLNWSLITTVIERWRPETHTFHLPIGEATITLQDVQVLCGLPADGLAVALPQYMRSMMHAQYLDLLQQFTGFRPRGEAAASGGSLISVTAIRQHSEVLHPDITGEIEDQHIYWYTRLALLLLFGSVLFPNTSENLVSMRFLHHLQQLDELPQYSWDAIVLAYL